MFRNPFRDLALIAVIVIANWSAALAEGTAPNTLVTNSITFSYNSGDGTPTVLLEDAATIGFRVDRKIDLGVTAQAAAGVMTAAPGQNAISLAFLLENRGNDTQGFVIAVDNGGSIGGGPGLTYSPTATTTPGEYYVMISADGTIAGGSVYDVTAAGNAGDLAPGEHYYVLIIANAPIGASNGQLDDFTVTGTATERGTALVVVEDRTQGLQGVNTAFADDVSRSTRTGTEIDVALNGATSDETRLQIHAPVIVLTKSVAVLDENLPGSTFDCAAGGTPSGAPLAAVPGACIEYTISIENTADSGTTADEITITDAIPANTTYAGHTAGNFNVTMTGAPVSSITATLATVGPNATESFTLRVIVE